MQRTQQSQKAEASRDNGRTEPAVGKAQPIPPELILDGRRYRLVPVFEECGSHAPASQELEAAVPARTPRPAGPVSPSPTAQVLTTRELEVVALVAEGRVNKEIADRLGISAWTVSTHLRRIFAKLDVDTRAAMVSRCSDLPGSREQ